MADDTRHDCPAPGCDKRVPFHILACKTHWYMIPKPVRDKLWREYDENFGETSYFKARAECLSVLGVEDADIPALNGGVGRDA